MSLTQVSIFHKLLIYLEDSGPCIFEDFQQFEISRRVIGSLGRLEGLKLVERDSKSKPATFKLSQAGDDYLHQRVSVFPIRQKSNHQLSLILLTSKTSHRSTRYTLLSLLKQIGAVTLDSGIWISPLYERVEYFKQQLQQNKLVDAVLFFDVDLDNGLRYHKPSQQLHDRYKKLFSDFNHYFKSGHKTLLTSFEAKCAIFALSEIVQEDILLLTGQTDKNWLGNEAMDWYNRFRGYITS